MRDPDQRVFSLRLSEELRFWKVGGVLSGAYQMAAAAAACKARRGEAAAAVTAATKKKGFDSVAKVPAATQSSYQG